MYIEVLIHGNYCIAENIYGEINLADWQIGECTANLIFVHDIIVILIFSTWGLEMRTK